MLNTKELIKRTYIKLYSQKGPQNLNIKQICLNTPVARTTFYSYYQNLTEVKDDIQKNLIDGILKIADDETIKLIKDKELSAYFEKVFEYIKLNWDDIYAFLILYPDFLFMEEWKKAIKKHFALRYPFYKTNDNFALIEEVIASAVLGAYIFWMKNPDKVNADKISEISVKTLDSISTIIKNS